MLQPKTFRRGEVIYREGAVPDQIYILQSGVVGLSQEHNGERIELSQVSSSQLLGEEALWGAKRWSASAIANNDVSALTVELRAARDLLNAPTPLARAFAQSVCEKARQVQSMVDSLRLESSPIPCPPEKITKLFAVLYHAATYTGTKKPTSITVVWPAFKKYCQRCFLESPVRLENAVYVLVRLGHAKLEYVPSETDPEAPDELGFVHFTNLDVARAFFEAFHKGAIQDPAHVAILREIAEWNVQGKVVPPGAPTDADAA